MQTLESLKSQGQASLGKLRETIQEQPDEVKVWGITAGSALVGAVAVNAAARGVVAIFATLASTPVALTVGAVGGGYLGWTYLRNWQAAEQDAAGTTPEPVATEIPVRVAAVTSATTPATEPVVAASVVAPSGDESAAAPQDVATEPVVDESIASTLASPAAPEPINAAPVDALPVDVSTVVTPDNLETINGIGPVYAKRLQNAGIQTFAQLAELSTDQIREIIGTARSGHMTEPEQWIAEAHQLAMTKTGRD